MKKYILILLLGTGAIFQGCGSEGTEIVDGSCTGLPLVGTWRSDFSGTNIVFKNDCTGTIEYCAGTFEWPAVIGASGTVLVTITSGNGATGCLDVGMYACEYAIVGDSMGYDCGGGVATYTRK